MRLDDRLAQAKIRHQACGIMIGRKIRTGDRLAIGAKGNEMVIESDHPAARIDTRLEMMPGGGTVEVVPHVIFAGPLQLHGRPVSLAIQAASTMKSCLSRRPKPPPMRARFTWIRSSGIPSVAEINALPPFGFCEGAQSSSLPDS